jgi:hypothetical protein
MLALGYVWIGIKWSKVSIIRPIGVLKALATLIEDILVLVGHVSEIKR